MMIKWENGAKVTFGRSLLQLYIQKYVSARELSLLVDVQPIGKACGRKLKCLVELPVDIGFVVPCTLFTPQGSPSPILWRSHYFLYACTLSCAKFPCKEFRVSHLTSQGEHSR
jgi:hypothetical protein